MTGHENAEAAGRTGPNRFAVGGGAFIAGFLLAAVLLIALGGNPLSGTNEVIYRDITVASVSAAEDQLCWSDRPEQRDAPQQCAILTLDPEASAPEAGQDVTIGLVEVATPDGETRQQVIYTAPVQDDPEPADT